MKVISVVFLVLVALFVIGGTRRPLGPVGDRNVVYWTPSDPCPEGQQYRTFIHEGDEWKDLRIPTLARPDPFYQMGECVAFDRDPEATPFKFRACCSNGESRCEEATRFGPAPDCTAIYEMGSGRRFQQVWVDQWNAAHAWAHAWQFLPCGCGETLEVEVRMSGEWTASDQNPIPEDGLYVQYGEHDDPRDVENWRIRCIKDGEPTQWWSYADIRQEACIGY